MPKSKRRVARLTPKCRLELFSTKKIDILIGTHSLLQDTVQFQNLGFVVADEQQRFGVDQRRALKQKGNQADFLLMSATPIPRTLASVLFNDLSISTIMSYHSSKKLIKTEVVKSNSIKPILPQIMDRLNQNDQIQGDRQ